MFSASACPFWRSEPAVRDYQDCNAEKTTKHKLKMVTSKLTSRFVAQTRLLFFVIAAASISPALQVQIGYAQNASEQPTVDTETHAVENSNADATTSPIQDKGGQVVNVKTFGAVGDGVTNDTDAFNAVLASLAKAGGGKCLVPKGTFLIFATTNPAITSRVSSNVHLVGKGRGISILQVAGVPAGA